MAWVERYANFDLSTGDNDGTSEANAWQTPAAVIAGVAAGNRVNIKRQASPYDLTSSITFNVAGTATAPIWYRAYSTTIGDGGLWEVRYNNASTVDLRFDASNCIVEGVDYQPGAATNIAGIWIRGLGTWAVRCRASAPGDIRFANTLYCDVEQKRAANDINVQNSNADNATVMYTRFSNSSSSVSGSFPAIVRTDLFGRVFSMIGCQIRNTGSVVHDGIFFERANSGRGILLVGNTFYNLDSGIHLLEQPDGARENAHIIGNLFSVIANYAVERTNTEVGYVNLLGNYYHSCTSGFTNYSIETEQFPNTALSQSPFETPGSDFTINETANGGAVLRSRGFPVLPAFDWDSMDFYPTYTGPTPSEVAEAVWTRSGRTLTA